MATKKMLNSVDMEAKLENLLRPVQPSRKFVQTVRRRIRRITPPVVIANRLDDTPHFLMLVGGVISVVVLIAVGARALFYIFSKAKS